MKYVIEYADGKCQNTAYGRDDLLDWLRLLKDEKITDIRKIFKNGMSETVKEKYERYIR